MRNKLSSLLLSLCITAIAIAQENTPPGWLSRLPLASNTTYMYVMERGNGATYNEAVNNAMLKVIRNTSLRIGVAIDISEVNKALQNGKDWDIVAVQHRIPINKVCEYRERKDESGFIVAVLCQVAKSGNVYPEFDEFIACYDNRTYSDEGALLKSVFIPGLGQMGKRRGHFNTSERNSISWWCCRLVLFGKGQACLHEERRYNCRCIQNRKTQLRELQNSQYNMPHSCRYGIHVQPCTSIHDGTQI